MSAVITTDVITSLRVEGEGSQNPLLLALNLDFGTVTVPDTVFCTGCFVLLSFSLCKTGITNSNLVVSLWLSDEARRLSAWHIIGAFVQPSISCPQEESGGHINPGLSTSGVLASPLLPSKGQTW